ncbi:MAG: type II toxin-antitoxin system RelE/ParE family toxin [Endomicrobium sp.]|jgi:putative addiction module killer protein|nr:type II toxin-antitoxin system RelE/ParE family toxin [Endomicrobium sp.]
MIDKKTAVYRQWFDSLPDNVQDEIVVFIGRLLSGNTSNCKSVGNGISELKINFQKGYRIYYTVLHKDTILLLLAGGSKGGNQKQQQKDIALAVEIRDYLKKQGVI